MSDGKVWFITGAGRGMGVASARAALAAGHAVVATDRNPDAVAHVVGEADDLLVVKLDVSSPDDAEVAANAAVERFGQIDVLVNNAGRSYKGYFEEMTPGQRAWWQAQDGHQSGDPAKLARALLAIADQDPPQRRFIAGNDAIALAEQKIADLRGQIDTSRDLSVSLAFDVEPPRTQRLR
jgi:NAD(P)-dependent dehydrogenase (short-subunit alcohol dehydrogenase family)